MMKKRIIGQVLEEEKVEIRELYKRLEGLSLINSTIKSKELDSQRLICLKVAEDIRATRLKYDDWWAHMGKKYNWESVNGCEWNINFASNDVILVPKIV